MRSIFTFSLVVLGSLALLPGVAGDTCLPTCEVPSHLTLGFLPPATVVQSGSSVAWSTLDIGHTASETPDATGDMCFNVFFTPQGGPASARFDLEDGVAIAQGEGEERLACRGTALPDGSFAVDYVCLYHPTTMNGTIVVTV